MSASEHAGRGRVPALPGLGLAAVVARTTGKRAAHAALPPYMLIGIVAAVAFAGNGMDASTVTGAALASPGLRLALLFGWVLSTLPVARLLLRDPQVFFLRSLPGSRSALLGVAGGGLLLVQLAWVVLWARGAGASAACAAVLAALGLQCHWLARPRGAWEWLRACLSLGAWLLAPAPLALPVAGLAVVSAGWQAWVRAPEPDAVGRDRLVRSSAPLAVASALGSAALRADRSAVGRALALAVGAYAGARLGAANNPAWGAPAVMGLASALCGAASIAGAATLTRPLLRAEAELAWLLDVCGASLRLRALSSILVVAACAGVAGAAAGALLALEDARAASLPARLGVGCAAGGALAGALVRITTRGTGKDGGRQLLALLGAYGALLLPFPTPEQALAALGGAAVLASAAAARQRMSLASTGGA